MEQRRRTPGLAEVTFLAYDRHDGVEEPRRSGSCGLSTKTMTAIVATCAAIGFIAYMLTSSSANSTNVTTKPEIKQDDNETRERLPRSILPAEYRLKIVPHLEEGKFTSSGNLRISIYCNVSTDKIILNAREITFDEVKLHSPSNDTVVTGVTMKNDSDVVFIKLNKPLKAGNNYELYIQFTGILNDVLQGFYRSSYVDAATNETRWMASTQFSPTYARRAFPCFDEPSFKARFKISIGRRKDMISISNMPLDSTEEIVEMPGFVWDHYPWTLKMSTYLVAFIVTDFKYVQVPNSANPVFKLWSRRDVLNQTEYMSKIGPQVLRYFEDYFDIPFPLKKQDMVALPEFGYSAMENWGLITFRESAMLVKEDEAVSSTRQSVASVTAHELAHQWFGNLVTPAWWSDLWLKEGFATFFGNLALNEVEPTWRVTDALVEGLQFVFEDDGLESSHPISVALNHTDQITEIFDTISYTKGCSIIHMMYHFLGPSVFRSGIQKYLRTYAYRNAEQDDLWATLTEEAHSHESMDKNVTVKTVMDTWTLQTGYPILQVQRNYDTGRFTVSQKRFYWMKESANDTEYWWIPLTWTKGGNPRYNETVPKVWLKNATLELQDTAVENEWVLFNLQQTGYYRVNYDDRNWKQLAASMRVLPPVVRSQLIDDAFAASKAGILNYEVTIELIQSLEYELDYLVWDSALRGLRYIHDRLLEDEAFNKMMLRLVQKIFETVGTKEKPDDGHRDRSSRGVILKWACEVGNKICNDHAYRYLNDWMHMPSGVNPIPANLRSWVYCTGLKHAGKTEWNFLWNQFLETSSGAEKELLLGALGCISDKSILSSYLEKSIQSDSGVRKQDGWYVFRAVAATPEGRDIAFNFLKEKWSTLYEYYGSGFSALTKLVTAIPKYMNTESELKQLEDFRDSISLGVTNRAFKRAIEEVKINVAWTTQYKKQVQHLLNKS